MKPVDHRARQSMLYDTQLPGGIALQHRYQAVQQILKSGANLSVVNYNIIRTEFDYLWKVLAMPISLLRLLSR